MNRSSMVGIQLPCSYDIVEGLAGGDRIAIQLILDKCSPVYYGEHAVGMALSLDGVNYCIGRIAVSATSVSPTGSGNPMVGVARLALTRYDSSQECPHKVPLSDECVDSWCSALV